MKMAKFIMLILLLTSLEKANAKGQQCIYKTLNDYNHKKPICTADSASEKTSIHVHHFFWNQGTVLVASNGDRHTYKKNELYAYTDNKHNMYRFYKNEEYLLAEAGPVYIYVQENNITFNKGYVVVNAYYFSTAPDSKIIKLNTANLKAAYADNGHFIDLLDVYFSNGDVHQYDNQHKKYRINYVFQKSVNK
jgi:hypothetical protein